MSESVATAMAWMTALGGVSAIAALIGSVWNIRRDVKGDSRQAVAQEAADRRDTIADRDGLIDQLQEEVADLKADLKAARADATREITDLKTEVRAIQRDLYLERAWNRTLVDQIYRGEPPPPRERPTD